MQSESRQQNFPSLAFLEIIFLAVFRMKLTTMKKENRFNAMPDTRFYFSWYQMFNFLIFADTRHFILCLLIHIYTYYITKLFAMSTKKEYVKVLRKKNTKLCRNLEKERLLKMLMLNLTCQEAAYMEEKWRKIDDRFKT